MHCEKQKRIDVKKTSIKLGDETLGYETASRSDYLPFILIEQ